MHNWEVVIQFQVHGQGKHLFGDGFAFWYTKEKGQTGPVFGSKDFFTGLGIFFDTYSNHNGEHKVSQRSRWIVTCGRTLLVTFRDVWDYQWISRDVLVF